MTQPAAGMVAADGDKGMARVKTIPAAHTRWAVAGMTTWALLSAAPSWAQGDELFNDYCAICHADDAVALSRAPDLAALQQLTPETILDVMTNGTMAVNAQSLSTDQRQVLAEFLAGRPFGSATSEDVVTLRNPCPSTPIGNPLQGPMWNGWGVDLGNSRLQPAEVAGLTAALALGVSVETAAKLVEGALGGFFGAWGFFQEVLRFFVYFAYLFHGTRLAGGGDTKQGVDVTMELGRGRRDTIGIGV